MDAEPFKVGRMIQPATVLITTYEDDRRMEITARGFMRQKTPAPFELIVVNDGGRTDTEAMLRKLWTEFEVACGGRGSPGLLGLHYYYLNPPSPDFRLAAARNLGLRHVTTPQTIICDCDTVPSPDMVAEHMKAFDEHTVLVGVRKHVTQHAVEAVLDLAKCDQDWLFKNAYKDDDRVNGTVPALRDKYLNVHNYGRPWEVTWGCNFSFPTERARSLGGFDEEFVGWGGEDEDIARRMFIRGARFRAIPLSYVYHLDHPRRTQQVASQVFYRKMNADPMRNGGPMKTEDPSYIGRIE